MRSERSIDGGRLAIAREACRKDSNAAHHRGLQPERIKEDSVALRRKPYGARVMDQNVNRSQIAGL